jgi:hypothetical protein
MTFHGASFREESDNRKVWKCYDVPKSDFEYDKRCLEDIGSTARLILSEYVFKQKNISPVFDLVRKAASDCEDTAEECMKETNYCDARDYYHQARCIEMDALKIARNQRFEAEVIDKIQRNADRLEKLSMKANGLHNKKWRGK